MGNISYPKMAIFKWNHLFQGPSFWVSMLVFGGVYTLLGGSSQLGSVVNIHGDVSKSPKDRVAVPLPNGRTSWLKNGADPITTY